MKDRPIKYVIQSLDEKDTESGQPLYWRNNFGWSCLSLATRFTENQVGTISHIPFHSKWVVLSEAKANDETFQRAGKCGGRRG